jgi:hypothetical protein
MKIPCEDCLCLPVCKSQAIKKNIWEKEYVDLIMLDKKCELFSKWYRSKLFKDSGPEIAECFGSARSSWLI